MSNCQTGRTSTTGSSTSSAFEVIACGALAGHIREIAARRGWPVIVRPLPARLHNRPAKIHQHSERIVATAQANGSRAVLAYADCGTYGALDSLCDTRGVKRLPGLHCYDLYAGPDLIAEIFAEEPGTYLLTDYLVRTFDRTVLAALGLDKHPDLWPDYFGHYTRVVWLAQEPTPALAAEAARIAEIFGLPLTRVTTGLSGLESALADLLAEPAAPRGDIGAVAHNANKFAPVGHSANFVAKTTTVPVAVVRSA